MSPARNAIQSMLQKELKKGNAHTSTNSTSMILHTYIDMCNWVAFTHANYLESKPDIKNL